MADLRYEGDPADLLDFSIADLLHPPAWHADAACREHPELTWFPARGEDVRPAQSICAECLVAAECLEAGRNERHGLWGGTSERARRRLRSPVSPAA